MRVQFYDFDNKNHKAVYLNNFYIKHTDISIILLFNIIIM